MHKYLGVTRNLCRSFTSLPNFFKISEEVTEGLSTNKPIVALESAVITHGLPYDENLSTARKVEEIVRENNAIPATIGILNGKIHIGMNSENMSELASNKAALKVSRRDLPYVISQHLSGGTTVAATMALAYRSGISVFVTGGIGGVHRGGETTMDVSADLHELARTPITVISAGVKSILDIGRTLEYLETLGVCVAAFGPSKVFPAFFSAFSDFQAPCKVETCEEAAALIHSRNELQLESGILIAAPTPDDNFSAGDEIEYFIQSALEDAKKKNIVGKDVTPFVLKSVQQMYGHEVVEANISLLFNNAQIGSQIAVALNRLNSSRPGPTSSRTLRSPVKHDAKDVFSSSRGRPVVIGGSILDIHVKALEDVKTF